MHAVTAMEVIAGEVHASLDIERCGKLFHVESSALLFR